MDSSGKVYTGDYGENGTDTLIKIAGPNNSTTITFPTGTSFFDDPALDSKGDVFGQANTNQYPSNQYPIAIFEVPSGKTTAYEFDAGGLTLSNGVLYGVTGESALGDNTVFSLPIAGVPTNYGTATGGPFNILGNFTSEIDDEIVVQGGFVYGTFDFDSVFKLAAGGNTPQTPQAAHDTGEAGTATVVSDSNRGESRDAGSARLPPSRAGGGFPLRRASRYDIAACGPRQRSA